jgi:hypothetical protein
MKKKELTQEIVRELLDYDKDTGKLTWKRRKRKWFKSDRSCNSWNAKHAGKEALTVIDKLGYRSGTILSGYYLAHRVIFLWMEGRWPDPEVDHDDHDTGNNRWKNLFEVTHQQNMKNKNRYRNSRTAVTGVRVMLNGCFGVYIGGIYFGYFKFFDDAVAAHTVAKAKYGYSVIHGTT